jgi:hypothetical protein
MSPKRRKRPAAKPAKKTKKAARRPARKALARKPARRPKPKARIRAKAAKAAKPKAASKHAPRSTARTNGAATHRGRQPEESPLEEAQIVEEETITIGGYDESEDFEEPYSEEEDDLGDDSDESY